MIPYDSILRAQRPFCFEPQGIGSQNTVLVKLVDKKGLQATKARESPGDISEAQA